MKSIHIRDIDPQVLGRIKALAALHHRSMQGELKAILEEAAKKAPESTDPADLDLITVETGKMGTWRREDMYDNAR